VFLIPADLYRESPSANSNKQNKKKKKKERKKEKTDRQTDRQTDRGGGECISYMQGRDEGKTPRGEGSH